MRPSDTECRGITEFFVILSSPFIYVASQKTFWRMRLKENVPGFTLIEVLLALTLFAIALVMLTQTFVNTLLSLNSIENEAAMQADLRFVRVQALQEANREKFEQGAEIETLSAGYARWEARVDSTQVSDLFKVLLTIELTLPENGDSRTFTQEILLLRPTWSDPVERSELIAENSERLNLERLEKDWP